MASWSNALNKTTLDINNGGPAIIYEVKGHDILASEEVTVEQFLDLRGASKGNYMELDWVVQVNSGTGTPKVVVKWLDGGGEVICETVATSSPIKLISQSALLAIRETGGAAANYGAIIRIQ